MPGPSVTCGSNAAVTTRPRPSAHSDPATGLTPTAAGRRPLAGRSNAIVATAWACGLATQRLIARAHRQRIRHPKHLQGGLLFSTARSASRGGGGGRFRWQVPRPGRGLQQFLRRLQRLLPLLALVAVVGFSMLHGHRPERLQELALSSFLDFVEHPTIGIRKAVVGSTQCMLLLQDGQRFSTHWPLAARPVAEELWAALRKAKVTIVAERTSTSPQFVFSGLIMMVYLFMVFSMLRRMTGGGGKSWGDSRGKVLKKEQAEGSASVVSRFADIAGIDGAKLEVQEVVEMLKGPSKYAKLGARVPRGLLLVGPPGTGKTLLARACAAEAGLPFISAAATEFVEMYVGRGAARVRQLFDRARKMAPCMIFIDEVDALTARDSGMIRSGSNQEAEQTLNQLLACMDGLTGRSENSAKPVVVVGATNRPEVLDEALLRPGRFDRVVRVELPDASGRAQILGVHMRLKRVPLAADASGGLFLQDFSERCDGLAGAALEALVNEAAIRAARRSAVEVAARDFEGALENYRGSRAPRARNFPWVA